MRRGRLRKRLRFLDRERELLLRDLGGLVYEIHRSGNPGDRERHRSLVAGKVERLAGLDHELGAGLATLGEARGEMVMREPGIGGSCPRCGEIHGSDARFCSACGFPLEVAEVPPSSIRPGPPPGDPVLPLAAATPVAPAAAPASQASSPTPPPSDDAPTQVAEPSAAPSGEATGPSPSRADAR